MSHNRVTISEAQEEEEEVVEWRFLPEGFSFTYWAGWLAGPFGIFLGLRWKFLWLFGPFRIMDFLQ